MIIIIIILGFGVMQNEIIDIDCKDEYLFVPRGIRNKISNVLSNNRQK